MPLPDQLSDMAAYMHDPGRVSMEYVGTMFPSLVRFVTISYICYELTLSNSHHQTARLDFFLTVFYAKYRLYVITESYMQPSL